MKNFMDSISFCITFVIHCDALMAICHATLPQGFSLVAHIQGIESVNRGYFFIQDFVF